MNRLTILVAICLISMCHDVKASNLWNSAPNSRTTSSLSSKPNNSKSNIKSNSKSSNRKSNGSNSNVVSSSEEVVVLSEDQMVEVEQVKKFIEENAPIFDLNGNCYNDMVSLPKGTYIRSGKEFKVE